MTTNRNRFPLKFALLADAVASGATGLLMAAGASVLAGLLSLPPALLTYAGLVLLPYAVFVALVGLRPVISRVATGWIVAINIAWSVASVALIAFGIVSPNLLGGLFVTAQALVVAGFAIMQIIGLRQFRPA